MSNRAPIESSTFRFGTRYMMVYTAACCVGFGLLAATHQIDQADGPNSHRLDSIFGALLEIIVLMVFLLVVGLGPNAVRHSFRWIGKICICFFAGGIVGMLMMAYAASNGANNQSPLILFAGWSGSFLIGISIAFKRSLRRLLKPS